MERSVLVRSRPQWSQIAALLLLGACLPLLVNLGAAAQLPRLARTLLLAGGWTLVGGALLLRLRDRNRELERHHRALVMLTRCNEALVRAGDEQSLLDEVCDTIIRVGGYRMCWVGYAEQDERRTIRPVAHAGYEAGYLATADLVWTDTDRGRGPGGTAVRTGRAVISRHVVSDPSFEVWRSEAYARGYRSLAALPLEPEGGPALGVLLIYSEAEDAFDDPEMSLLRELAGDLAYGVMALRGRAERLAMTAHLVQADRLVSVGTLAAGVAHEINNPLAYVVAALEYIEDELGSLGRELPAGRLDAVGEALADAREGARRVTTIVRDLRTYARGDEERTGPVDLHRVLDSSIHVASSEIRPRALLVKDYGEVPTLLGSEGRLGQVFVNLLVNAAQAIPEGDAAANEVRVSTRTDGAGRAVVEIRDSGIGIAPEILRRVFDPFFTTKPVGVGMGLGLFVCRNLVAAAGGEISVDSAPGVGTVFRVVLPPEIPAPPGTPRGGPPLARP